MSHDWENGEWMTQRKIVWEATGNRLNQIQRIVASIGFRNTVEEVELIAWDKAAKNPTATLRWTRNPDPRLDGWMVSIEGEEVSLSRTLGDAVECGVNELVNYVIQKEIE